MTTGDLFLALDKLQKHIDEVKELFRARGGPDVHELIDRACAGKKRYTNPEAAGQGALSAKEKGSTDELRIYSCAFCGGYHLTKTTLERLAGISS